MPAKKRILTGDRPTGRLHIGHLVGSLQNRVRLQNEYDTFIIIADVQALTTHFEDPRKISESILGVAVDNLSAGLDPNKITLFLQSMVPAIAELTVFYSMLVSVNVLRHNPTIKTEAAQYGYDDLTYGFLGYPVSQAADITFCGADLVPVGDDQLPHMELARKLVRRFNSLYGETLKEPEPLLSSCPRLSGLDGAQKMGKSAGNAVFLTDDSETVSQKVRSALTDTNRISVKDKGDPSKCVVSAYHQAFNKDEYENICSMCRSASVGCVACKKQLAQALNQTLDPIRERRSYYENHLSDVGEIIRAGTKRAQTVGEQTVSRVKKALGNELFE